MYLNYTFDLMDSLVWYTYVDWTLEKNPRCFYVGKGNISRVKDVKNRNIVWKRIAEKYGQRREVVFSSDDESACFDLEQQLILRYKTCPYVEDGWGANLSLGGPGPTGFQWSEESKQNLSSSLINLWRDPVYRNQLMSLPPIDIHQLEIDGVNMVWDDIAQKYDVSASTVKRWFCELGLKKQVVGRTRKTWTETENKTVMSLYAEQRSVRFIACQLERSECSVKKRIQFLCKKMNIERSRYRRCV